MADQGLGEQFASLWDQYAPEPWRSAGNAVAQVPSLMQQFVQANYAPGLRREDVTDIPAQGGWARSFGSQPNDPAIGASTDAAGLAMTGGFAGVPGTAAETVLGAGPIRAYHGSPYDFNKFDLSKVGTGEGAQAYGHGLYFAENPAVAETYKAAGQPYYLGADRISAAQQLLQDVGGDRTAAINRAQEMMSGTKKYSEGKLWQDVINNFDQLTGRGPGKMYEVNINADPQQFLDWERPLKDQPIAETIARLVPKDLRRPFESNVASGISGGNAYHNYIPSESFAVRGAVGQPFGPSGAKTYEEALQSVGGNRDLVRTILNPDRAQTSAVLRDAGIPGISYLDQGSRNFAMMKPEPHEFLNGAPGWKVNGPKGDMAFDTLPEAQAYIAKMRAPETNNYVVFNPDLVDILKKYAVPGAIGAGAYPAVTDHLQQ